MISFLSYSFWFAMSFGSAWLIMHSMECLIKISPQNWKRCILFPACWLLSAMTILIGDSFNILATIPCFLAAIFLTCEGSHWKKITIGAMYASTIFSFNALRDNYLKNPYRYTQTQMTYNTYIQTYHYRILIFSAAASFLFCLFLYAGMKKFVPDKEYTLSDSLWKLLFLLTVTPLGIVLSVTVFFTPRTCNSYFMSGKPTEYMILLILALLSFISLLWCITVLARQQKLERRNMFMEVNRKYYEAMEQQHFEIRRLKHDLANHMQALASLPEEQRDSYIRKLADHMADMPALSYCGDATVNAVLSVKKAAMERYGIHMELSVDIPSHLPFDKTDVCALYANALDNAIEACMKLEESERIITVKSKAQKGLFCLEICNPLPTAAKSPGTVSIPQPAGTGKFPPTSKTDSGNHGFGLKSIWEIVARYQGRMEWKTENGTFDLFLYIPL